MKRLLLLLPLLACARAADKPINLTIHEFARTYVASCQDICQSWGIKRVTFSGKAGDFYSTCECRDPINIGKHPLKVAAVIKKSIEPPLELLGELNE